MLKSILLLSSITMITNFKILVQTKREFLVVARARVGWGKGNISFGGAFRRNRKCWI